MTPLEDEIRDALRSEATRLREVRPLRLEPALSPSMPLRRARRLRPWLAPVTAAALVITLAISLVIVRAAQNGPVPPVTPQPSTPTAFPRYYVALEQLNPEGNAARLVVGDSVTGKTLAAFNAPAGAAFETATGAGAADDRTFVVAETIPRGGPTPASSFVPGPRAWYLLRLSPGSASQVTMTRLDIQSSAADLPVSETVLSADGRYLAVTSEDSTTRRGDLRVYSVVTGQLVHAWTMVGTGTLTALYPYDLSWVNGDDTIAFAISVDSRVQVRTVSVTAPGTGLLTASHVVWSQYVPAVVRSLPKPGTATWCARPTLTADGQAVTCEAWPSYPEGAMEWLAYRISAPTTRRVIARIPPVATKLPKGIAGFGSVVVYVSASEVIGYWFAEPRYGYGPLTIHPQTIHKFIASGGTIRQLGTGTNPPYASQSFLIW